MCSLIQMRALAPGTLIPRGSPNCFPRKSLRVGWRGAEAACRLGLLSQDRGSGPAESCVAIVTVMCALRGVDVCLCGERVVLKAVIESGREGSAGCGQLSRSLGGPWGSAQMLWSLDVSGIGPECDFGTACFSGKMLSTHHYETKKLLACGLGSWRVGFSLNVLVPCEPGPPCREYFSRLTTVRDRGEHEVRVDTSLQGGRTAAGRLLCMAHIPSPPPYRSLKPPQESSLSTEPRSKPRTTWRSPVSTPNRNRGMPPFAFTPAAGWS